MEVLVKIRESPLLQLLVSLRVRKHLSVLDHGVPSEVVKEFPVERRRYWGSKLYSYFPWRLNNPFTSFEEISKLKKLKISFTEVLLWSPNWKICVSTFIIYRVVSKKYNFDTMRRKFTHIQARTKISNAMKICNLII